MAKEEKKKDKKADYKTPLEAYAKEIGIKPMILYLMANRTAVLIPIEEEDIDKRLVKVYGNLHELNLNKAYNLIYYDTIKKKVLTQNMLILFESNFFTLDNESVFDHYLLAYVKDSVPLLDKIQTAIETLQNQLKKVKTPEDVKSIQMQIAKLKDYVKKLIAKSDRLKQVGILSDHLTTPTSVMTPKEMKHLDPETKELDDVSIEMIYDSLYGDLDEDEEDNKNDKK
jgi:hypothetical protein